MYRLILVPLDGNTFAEGALPVAVELASRSGARLHLVYVLDPLRRPAFAAGVPPHEWWGGRAVDAALEYLSGIEARPEWRSRVKMTHAVLKGTIDEELLAEASKTGADLIVMTTHGRKPVQRFWLGSTADRISRSSPVPVLFLRATDTGITTATEFKRILVPLDGSDLAESALPHARDLARLEEAELRLVYVLQPIQVPAAALPIGMDLTAPLVEGLAQTEEAAAGYLEGIAEELEYGNVSTEVVTSSGPVAEEILALADRRAVDAIVLASAGRGGVRRLMLGSVADKLLRGANVPVLLYPPPGRD